ncbi:S8 family serine peptidase [Nonomuraea phyllanthi]|uniref:S8 family serine peptidase n=1 Tax=Nonomuraea phyllanthi TaxID=2219224 RepID=A0A5C4WMM7_9ACTN|nr:S8/S53 family peptidase [Nonomuraea phyllanthi]KAB8194562.1 S8 family serine peptidase [Nonomuraea phyllanthi]QFY08987.1 S8 family serine peptidase [Nonomuraea phyllanthi]
MPTSDTRFWEQLEILNAALPDGMRAAAGPEGTAPGSDVTPRFAHLAGHVLVHSRDTDLAVTAVQDLQPARERVRVASSPDGAARCSVHRLSIGSRDCHETVAALAGEGLRASPVHFVSVAGVNLCPGDEPVPSAGPLNPPMSGRDRGENVTVAVLDTGLVHDYLDHQWLAANSGLPAIPPVTGDVTAPGDELDADGLIKPYVGHGTFIAGVLRCVAPATDVRVHNVFPYAGAALEDELGLTLLRALDAHGWPDIISLSAGTATCDAATLLGLSAFMDELADHPGTLLVAAAGNDGGTHPFWPAAYAGEPVNASGDVVLSVGALREDGLGRACFSNHGDWVTVYAPGERLVNAFTSGPYMYGYPHRTTCRFSDPGHYPGCTCVATLQEGDKASFTGLAAWSGTSFATPIVAGLVAARMSQEKISSREAAAQLMASRLTVPDLSGFLR